MSTTIIFFCIVLAFCVWIKIKSNKRSITFKNKDIHTGLLQACAMLKDGKYHHSRRFLNKLNKLCDDTSRFNDEKDVHIKSVESIILAYPGVFSKYITKNSDRDVFNVKHPSKCSLDWELIKLFIDIAVIAEKNKTQKYKTKKIETDVVKYIESELDTKRRLKTMPLFGLKWFVVLAGLIFIAFSSVIEQVGEFGDSGDSCPIFGFGNNNGNGNNDGSELSSNSNDNSYKVFRNEIIETEIECDSASSSEWKSIKLVCKQNIDCKECQIFHNGVPMIGEEIVLDGALYDEEVTITDFETEPSLHVIKKISNDKVLAWSYLPKDSICTQTNTIGNLNHNNNNDNDSDSDNSNSSKNETIVYNISIPRALQLMDTMYHQFIDDNNFNRLSYIQSMTNYAILSGLSYCDSDHYDVLNIGNQMLDGYIDKIESFTLDDHRGTLLAYRIKSVHLSNNHQNNIKLTIKTTIVFRGTFDYDNWKIDFELKPFNYILFNDNGDKYYYLKTLQIRYGISDAFETMDNNLINNNDHNTTIFDFISDIDHTDNRIMERYSKLYGRNSSITTDRKLIITGHSLGGALAQRMLLQILLPGYINNVNSVEHKYNTLFLHKWHQWRKDMLGKIELQMYSYGAPTIMSETLKDKLNEELKSFNFYYYYNNHGSININDNDNYNINHKYNSEYSFEDIQYGIDASQLAAFRVYNIWDPVGLSKTEGFEETFALKTSSFYSWFDSVFWYIMVQTDGKAGEFVGSKYDIIKYYGIAAHFGHDIQIISKKCMKGVLACTLRSHGEYFAIDFDPSQLYLNSINMREAFCKAKWHQMPIIVNKSISERTCGMK